MTRSGTKEAPAAGLKRPPTGRVSAVVRKGDYNVRTEATMIGRVGEPTSKGALVELLLDDGRSTTAPARSTEPLDDAARELLRGMPSRSL